MRCIRAFSGKESKSSPERSSSGPCPGLPARPGPQDPIEPFHPVLERPNDHGQESRTQGRPGQGRPRSGREGRPAPAAKAATAPAAPAPAAKAPPKAADTPAPDRPKPANRAVVYTALAETTGLGKKEVAAVFSALGALIAKELGKQGPGQFVVPGLLKLKVVRKPATKARPGKNPFTGEPMTIQAKPARNVVRAVPMKAPQGDGLRWGVRWRRGATGAHVRRSRLGSGHRRPGLEGGDARAERGARARGAVVALVVLHGDPRPALRSNARGASAMMDGGSPAHPPEPRQ